MKGGVYTWFCIDCQKEMLKEVHLTTGERKKIGGMFCEECVFKFLTEKLNKKKGRLG